MVCVLAAVTAGPKPNAPDVESYHLTMLGTTIRGVCPRKSKIFKLANKRNNSAVAGAAFESNRHAFRWEFGFPAATNSTIRV